MLQQLTITNFGLIDRVELTFDRGLNILTGETGAGKSILIDALRCVLGERMDTSFVRDTQKPCTIEAVFTITDKALRREELITEFLDPSEDTLIIQRQIGTDGKAKVRINGLTTTVGQLKAVGNLLIDFHGPHDHQQLLSEERHLGMLDQLVSFDKTLKSYTDLYQEYRKLQNELAALAQLSQTRQRDVELLAHEVKELESVPLNEEKYQDVCQAQTKINNAQRLLEHAQHALSLFDDEQAGIDTQLRRAFTPIKNLTHIDPALEPLAESLTQLQEQARELNAQISDYADSLDFDASEAEEMVRQFDAYSDILRKYGPTLADAQKYYADAKAKHDLIKNFADTDADLRDKISDLEKAMATHANAMSKERQKAAASLNKTVEGELKDLGIAHVKFEVRFEKTAFGPNGRDNAVFYISPNAGEDLKPLAEIVSSGEAARVMLALKKALIKVDPVPVLIFDEIDAQIGGRLGSITGKKLKELSESRQVILITHLPQIAAFADIHLKVVKTVKAGRAVTGVDTLDAKTRVEELAQMMSGQDTTKISLSHAKDMLAAAKK